MTFSEGPFGPDAKKSWIRRGGAKVRGFFERALALDPGTVLALVGGALADIILCISLMTGRRRARFAAAEAALNKALSLTPNYAVAHVFLGVLYNGTGRAAQALAECEHTLALDRNIAGDHAEIGTAKIWLVRTEETEDHVREALRLSPLDTMAYVWMCTAGTAKCFLGRVEEVVSWLRRSIEANRNWPLTHFYLAAALAHLGRLDEARAAAQAALALQPSFAVGRLRAGAAKITNPIFAAQVHRALDGMAWPASQRNKRSSICGCSSISPSTLPLPLNKA